MSNEENNVEEVVENKPFSVIGFIEENSRNLLYAGIALIIVAVGVWYYTSVMVPQKEADANDELFRAEAMFANDSLDIALNGSDQFLGLIDIAEEYGSTKAGNRASYYAAAALMKKGEFEDALNYLKNASFDDEIIAPLAVCLQGDCNVELENLEEAASLYMKAAKMRDNKFSTPYCYAKAARVYSKLGNWQDALDAWTVISEDYNDTQFARGVDKEIARAKAALN
jgi:tetratricopeptide (TPR) repeat protein